VAVAVAVHEHLAAIVACIHQELVRFVLDLRAISEAFDLFPEAELVGAE